MFEHLKNQFKNRQIDKEYLALAHDEIQKDHEVIDFGIKRSADKNRMSAVPKSQTENGAKTAITEFDVEKRFKNFTLLRVKIHTGRSHQIRAHMLAYDHPITGDKIYFQKKRKYQKDKECERLFLHCTKLVFADLNNEHKKYSSPLPSELCAFLEKIK
jgi:23S rRNA-/tRNA-specific pseudouridylate synthase